MPHTPGPWELTTKARITTANNKADICLTNIRLDEADANARLIAAAPELLEALEHFMEGAYLRSDEQICGYCGYTGRHNDVCRVGKAEAAIRKAKGIPPTTANADTHAAHESRMPVSGTTPSGSVPTERKLS